MKPSKQTHSRLTKRGLPLAAGLMLAAFSSASFAHYPFCTCKLEANNIQCEGGFSDGSGAVGVTVDLISYEEEVVNHQAFDAGSKANFNAHAGEFYILMDAGPGHTVEVDWSEVEGLTR